MPVSSNLAVPLPQPPTGAHGSRRQGQGARAGWLGKGWTKKDGMPDIEFQGYRYFDMPFEHGEFTESGVMGNPHRAAAYKGEIAFNRFANHLIDAVHELEKVDVKMHDIDWTAGKTMGGTA
jgi:hypothetical protein